MDPPDTSEDLKRPSQGKDRVIEKYLTQFAEPEISDLAVPSIFEVALVIPAFQESASTIGQLIKSLPSTCLPILVINAPEEDAHTLNLFRAMGALPTIAFGRHWSLRTHGQAQQLLVFEYCLDGHYPPPKQGVGLARKVGVDAALKLHQQGVLQSDRIYLTDADATLPRDYFSTSWPKQAGAVVFPYLHRLSGSNEAKRATLLFECRLRHYESGLRYAGSGYAYPTLGSLIGVRAGAYAAARGMPKRAAGEDFYLLNKLRKLGDVARLSCRPIRLENRASARVPMGTGPSLIQLIDALSDGRMPGFYNPSSFESLKCLLDTLWNLETPDQILQIDDEAIQDFAETTDLLMTLEQLRNAARTQSRLQQSLLEWFDGFRQLKFIHFLRDRHHPLVTLEQAISAPWFNETSRAGFSQVRYRQLRTLATGFAETAMGPVISRRSPP